MLSKEELIELYLNEGLSAAMIAKKLRVSENKINYWLMKYGIPKRSISDAVYLKRNPDGDPFSYQVPKSNREWLLFGLGIGLYWGEGNKRNKSSLRLGNVDPELIKAYMLFLHTIYGIRKESLKFGLQIFSDVSPVIAKNFWIKELCISSDQFQKVIVTPSRKIGTYKNKSQYGVITVYFNNTKLKKKFDELIENFPAV